MRTLADCALFVQSSWRFGATFFPARARGAWRTRLGGKTRRIDVGQRGPIGFLRASAQPKPLSRCKNSGAHRVVCALGIANVVRCLVYTQPIGACFSENAATDRTRTSRCRDVPSNHREAWQYFHGQEKQSSQFPKKLGKGSPTGNPFRVKSKVLLRI